MYSGFFKSDFNPRYFVPFVHGFINWRFNDKIIFTFFFVLANLEKLLDAFINFPLFIPRYCFSLHLKTSL